jgi:arsenite methyltransferase
MSDQPTAEQITRAVKERYSAAAKQVLEQNQASCCGPSTGSSCCGSGAAPVARASTIGAVNYDPAELGEIPEDAALASLGCGNPTLLAQLGEGEVVLDLGSGGGIDVLLSARRVGPTGKAYGLDMTDEMLQLARQNAAKAGVQNVEFLKGNIESIPLPSESVDVIISNCVINLSPDKDRVLAEAFRVLKPGGRFAVSDIVVQGGPLPESAQRLMALWASCIAGALTEDEYRAKLAAAGFGEIDVEVLSVYSLEDVPEGVLRAVSGDLALPEGTRVISGFVRATKGGSASKARAPRVTLGKTTAFQVKKLSSSCCGSPADAAQPVAASCCGDAVKGYFKEVAEEWDELRQGYFTEAVRDAAVARAGLTSESVVADVGTGTGFMLAGLVPLVSKAYGFDSSPEMLEVARRNLAGAANVELRVSEGDSLPVADAGLDAAFANMYLHHTPDPAAAVAELARVVRPGGRLVLTDLDSHDHEWMRDEMADVWMGFDRSQVAEWFRRAGLTDVKVEPAETSCCGTSSCGDEAAITVFVASGTRP